MKTVLVCAILGVWMLPCMAAETFTDRYDFCSEGVLCNSVSNSWKGNSRAHYMKESGGCTQVTQATLTINDHGIGNVWWNMDRDSSYEQMDFTKVTFRGRTLGQQRGRTVTSNLPPSPLAGANPGGTFPNGLYDKGDCIINFDWHNAAWLKSPTLDVIGQGSPVAVPAPGALVLAGIGTILVGTLRRRKTT